MHLRFAVGARPLERTVASQLMEASVELVRECQRQWHALGRLISSIAEHKTLRDFCLLLH